MNMNQNELNEFRNNLQTTLQNSIMKITFVKKDGTERIMNCTLKEELLPKKEINSNSTQRKQSLGVLPVFDTDINEWRSIILDNIVEIQHP